MTGGPRVLVADDEDDIRALVGVAVHRAGCTLVASVADLVREVRTLAGSAPA